MEGKKAMMIVAVMAVVMGMVAGQDLGGGIGGNFTIPFVTCYGKCYFFCVIEPKNVCTCTSQCLKQCLDTPPTTMALTTDENTPNLSYCKLGCATSLCSNISKPHSSDEENMGRCVDSCSNKCALSYN